MLSPAGFTFGFVTPDRSDLSGAVLDGDAPSHVTLLTDDGAQLTLRMTAAERADLESKGIVVRGPRARILRWIKTIGRKSVPWALGLLIGSLALPALTRQWSDRQAALELKNALITDVSTSSVGTYLAARRITDFAEAKAERTRQLVLDEWVLKQSGLDARFGVYFPRGSGVLREWTRYVDAVYTYIELACCTDNRRGALAHLAQYFFTHEHPRTTFYAGDGDPWKVLRCGP